MNGRHLSLLDLHPVAVTQFAALFRAIGEVPELSSLRPFETYRTPEAQQEALDRGASKVGPWHSVHQYGVAVDFVSKEGGKWVWWKSDDHRWQLLQELAFRYGCDTPIKWDRPHVVLRGWKPSLVEWLKQQSFT